MNTEVNSKDKCQKLWNTIQEGDTVTALAPVAAYYSNYGGRPRIVFSPGMLATVARIQSNNVICSDAYKDCSVVVDFMSEATGKMERAALWYQNVKLVEGK